MSSTQNPRFVRIVNPDPNAIVAHAFGQPADFHKPCVDCGEITPSYCDGGEWDSRLAATGQPVGAVVGGAPCLAAERMPDDVWRPGQRTPFCAGCEAR